MKKNLVLLFVLFSVASLTVAAETPIITVIACDASGNAINIGSVYTIRGVVTSPNMPGSGIYHNLSFYVQDSTGAVDVFKAGSVSFDGSASYSNKGLVIGSDVTITGTVAFYRGVVELIPASDTDIVVNGAGPVATPIPQIITIDDLQDLTGEDQARFNMRCKLVKLGNVFSTGAVAWPTSGYANFTIAVGGASNTPTGNCYIAATTDIPGTSQPTWPQNITGIFSQYDSSSPYLEGFEIAPRMYADFAATASTVGDWDMY